MLVPNMPLRRTEEENRQYAPSPTQPSEMSEAIEATDHHEITRSKCLCLGDLMQTDERIRTVRTKGTVVATGEP